MREIGPPKLQAWRWAPCAAFVLGSLSFVTFALVAIPDHIGQVDPESTTSSLRFGGALARTQSPPTPQNDWSGDTTNTASATPGPGVRSEPSLVTQNADGSFPKRGFTPPLERPQMPVAPPQQQPPQQQPQLNVPPPVPAPPPAAEPPPPAPQPELMPQAAPASAPPAAEPAPAPAPN